MFKHRPAEIESESPVEREGPLISVGDRGRVSDQPRRYGHNTSLYTIERDAERIRNTLPVGRVGL